MRLGPTDVEFVVRIFSSRSKVCPRMPTYLNAHAKVKKWIFEVQFPGNWFKFGIIGNDFWSSTFWAIQNLTIRLEYVFRISSGVPWSINWSTNVKTDKEFAPSSLATVRDVSTAECQSVVKWGWRTNTSIEWDEIEKGTLNIFVSYVRLKYGSNKGHMRLK